MERRRILLAEENNKFYDELKVNLTTQTNNTEPPKISQCKNILVAEDEEFNRIFLGELLSETHSKIIWAVDGVEAVEYFKVNSIDLILMDIKMPRLSGIEAVKQIRILNNKIPIIAQTAFAMEDEEMKFKAQGFNDFIKKPINISEFIEKVDYWLNKYEFKSNPK
jgi:two-component system, cell cycle response regulator DivK